MAERWPVLLMVRELGLGGSERQTSLMAASLDRARFVPYVGCFRSAGIRRRELDEAGVPVVEFPVTSFRSLSAWRGGRGLLDFLQLRGILLVHAFDYPTALFAAPLVPFRRRTRMVSSQRSHRELTPGWTRWALRLTDHMVDRVVVNCDFVRRHLIEEEKFPPERLTAAGFGSYRPLQATGAGEARIGNSRVEIILEPRGWGGSGLYGADR